MSWQDRATNKAIFVRYATEGIAACTDNSNRIWFMANLGSSGDTRKFYEYNISANTFTERAMPAGMPSTLAYIGALVYANGRVFYVGGSTSGFEGTTWHRALIEYNPSTNTWTDRGSSPSGIDFRQASNYQGGIASAVGAGSKAYVVDRLTERLYEFDGATFTFTLRASNITGAGNPAPSVWNNKVYIECGADTGGGSIKSVSLSDWSVKTEVPLLSRGIDFAIGRYTNDQIWAAFQATLGFGGNASQEGYFAGGIDLARGAGTSGFDTDGPESTHMAARESLNAFAARTGLGRIRSAPRINVVVNGVFWALLYKEVGFPGAFGGTEYGVCLSAARYTLPATPPVPTAPAPASGSTVRTDIPTVSAVVTQYSTERHRIRWELARDSAFTIDKKVIYSRSEVTRSWSSMTTKWADKTSGTLSQQLTGPESADYLGVVFRPYPEEELYQGTWYIRARQENLPYVSAWTATQSFTVSHPPSAAPTSPISDQTLDFAGTGAVTFTWQFSDTSPTDFQTAFQIIVERNDTGEMLLDTGKIASQQLRQYPWNLPAAHKDFVIRWKIRAWDSDDVVGPYSSYALFRMSDKPTIEITEPAEDSEVTSGNPTVKWTVTASAGRVQSSARVRFYTLPSEVLIHDSGIVSGPSLQYTPTQQILDEGQYQVRVDVTDSRGLSNFDTNTFSTSYDAPDSPDFTVDASRYADEGYILVSWNSAAADDAFYSWRVFRRMVGQDETKWELLYETTKLGALEFRDYSAGSTNEYEYVVVQVAYRFGMPLESTKAIPGPQVIQGFSSQYWLLDKTDPTLNILLRNVVGDEFSDEWEEETINLIGRGRSRQRGTRWGFSGSLSAQIRNLPDGTTARELRLRLELARADGRELMLRNPFGDVWQVDLGALQISRVAGVGTNEFVDVTIPYMEVS